VRARALALLAAFAAAGAVSAAAGPDGAPRHRGDPSKGRWPPTVVFMTDFGTKDDSVALCKGVMWTIHPSMRIVDLTHEVTPYDVAAAGRLLEGTIEHYPAGTVFVVVVDPGVGSERRSIAVRTKKGHLLVGPDNGVFTRVLDREGLDEARELKEPRYWRDRVSGTFHGRDVFSPVGGHLAAGVPLSAFGPVVEDLVRLPLRRARAESGGIRGEVAALEVPYGNVLTDIPSEFLEGVGIHPGVDVEVSIGTRTWSLPYRRTFSDVAEGTALALPSSRDKLCLAVNMGDFAKTRGVAVGESVFVRRKR